MASPIRSMNAAQPNKFEVVREALVEHMRKRLIESFL
jgi:hypothetical protein